MRSPIDPFTPAVELAAAIRRKEVSPVEVADCYLERMDKLDPRLNAFCHRADDVRNAASAAADAVVRAASAEDLPPFHGVPLPIKDLPDVAGWPTTYGSAGASRAPAPVSDPVVQRLVVPATGMVTGRRVIISRKARVTMRSAVPRGLARAMPPPCRSSGRQRSPRSPSVAIAGQARSHGSGSYQVDAHDPVAGGRDSAAAAVFTTGGVLMASVAYSGIVLPGRRRPPDGSRCR